MDFPTPGQVRIAKQQTCAEVRRSILQHAASVALWAQGVLTAACDHQLHWLQLSIQAAPKSQDSRDCLILRCDWPQPALACVTLVRRTNAAFEVATADGRRADHQGRQQ